MFGLHLSRRRNPWRFGWTAFFEKVGLCTGLIVSRDSHTYDELVRLAETSPHLLDDIGFVRCQDCEGSGDQVWWSSVLGLELSVIERQEAICTERVEGGQKNQPCTLAEMSDMVRLHAGRG